MTANFQPGYRLVTGDELNTQINTAVTGPTGAVGATGAAGPTGAVGATGTIGSTGPTGSIGPTGAGAPVAAPIAANSTGTAGTWAYDATNIYVCVATDTWCKATIATF